MNNPWVRDGVTSGFQWAYDNRAYLSKKDKEIMAKYRDYQEKTKRYKEIARGSRRLTAKRALDFGGMTPADAKRQKFMIPYRGPTIDNKRRLLHTEAAASAGKVLYAYPMTDIPLATTDTDLTRNKSVIFCKGINVRVGFRNLQGVPLLVNVAVVAAKNAMPGASGIPLTNFFRNTGLAPSSQRYIDFSNDYSARELHYATINTEQWTVLNHTRRVFNTTGDGDVISEHANRGGGRDDFGIIEKYIKINRRLTYDSIGGDTCTTPIWLVVWFSRWDQARAATPVANTAQTWLHAVTHFKDDI